MTGMERVLRALRGEPADRRAFTLALSLYGSRLTECPTREYYSDPVRYLEGQREVVRLVGPDIVLPLLPCPLKPWPTAVRKFGWTNFPQRPQTSISGARPRAPSGR